MVPSWWSARVRLARALGSTLIRRRLTCNGWRGCALVRVHTTGGLLKRLVYGEDEHAIAQAGRPWSFGLDLVTGAAQQIAPQRADPAFVVDNEDAAHLALGITRDPAHRNFQSCGSAEVAIPPRCRDLPDGGAMLVFAGSFVRSRGVDYAVSQARRDRRRQ